MCKLKAENVTYSYTTKYQKTEAVKDVSCSFESGKMYAIVGESGSGKSTFLSLLAGLDLPDSGAIYADGKSLEDVNRDDYRKTEASVVYQAYHLLPLLTAKENVMFPLEMRKIPRSECKKTAEEILNRMGINEELHDKYPKMMSGGEQQRVAIARAVAAGTKILLADEPTGNLDSENEENIVSILMDLAHNEGYLVIVVTHNMFVAGKADKVYSMKDGILKQES